MLRTTWLDGAAAWTCFQGYCVEHLSQQEIPAHCLCMRKLLFSTGPSAGLPACYRATREALGGFEAKAETQELRIEVLAGQVEDLERRLAEQDAPLLLRIVRGFWRFLFGKGKTG